MYTERISGEEERVVELVSEHTITLLDSGHDTKYGTDSRYMMDSILREMDYNHTNFDEMIADARLDIISNNHYKAYQLLPEAYHIREILDDIYIDRCNGLENEIYESGPFMMDIDEGSNSEFAKLYYQDAEINYSVYITLVKIMNELKEW